jgi:ATP-binding cassette subfamily B protein
MLPDNATPSLTPRRLSPLKGLLPFLRPYRARVALAFILLCLASATILLVPLAFRDLIDFGFGKRVRANGGLLGALSLNGHFIALFGLASFWALAVAARFYTFRGSASGSPQILRSAVYAAGAGAIAAILRDLQTGEVLSRLTGDTTLIQTVVGSSISMGLRSLFQFIGGMVMLAVTSFYLFSLNLGLMALLILPIIAIGRKVKKLSRESQDRIADASALAGEILNAMPTVQAYTQETQEARRFAARTEPVSSPRSSAPACGRRSRR